MKVVKPVLGRAILAVLAVPFLCVGQESQEAASAEYQTLSTRVELNDSFFNRYQFSMWDEARTRDSLSTEAAVSARVGGRDSETALRSDWETYIRMHQKHLWNVFDLDAIDLEASWDAAVSHVEEISFGEAGYTIEVMTWQGVPGIYLPATLYKPKGQKNERLPVVISPLGCSEDVATHEDYTSVQRRLANLALSGIIAFTTEGFCLNGLFGAVPGNEHYYMYYASVAGAGVSTGTLELATWIRALDYLASRSDTDMNRVGVTGYSNGAGITLNLAAATDRVHAIAPVALGIGARGPRDIYTDVRNGIVFSHPPYAYFNEHWGPTFGSLSESGERLHSASLALGSRWTSSQLAFATRFGAPKSLYAVLGEQEGNDLAARSAIEEAQVVWRNLGGRYAPRLDVVPGEHNFDALRRNLVTRWLVDVLEANPLLPLLDQEHETPILPKESLQMIAEGRDSETLHDIFGALARQEIAIRSQTFRLRDLKSGEARAHLRGLLKLDAQDGDVGQQMRPLLVDEVAMTFGGESVKFQYWLLSINEHIRTVALALSHSAEQDSKREKVLIRVVADSLLPTEKELVEMLTEAGMVVSVVVPGFGPTATGQTTTGDLARQTARVFPLLAMGVKAVEETLDLIETLSPVCECRAMAQGVDAGNVLLFAAALDDRLRSVELHQSLKSFRTIFTAPTQPVVPPTLLIPGLLADVDVPELVELAKPTVVEVVSESDLSEFSPWDRVRR